MPRKQPQLAKLTRPRLHKAVARERLFALLDESKEHKPAICVVGPPGAGKTTLVASWLDARGIKGIWYQVDPGDTDLATFFYYLGEAAKPFLRKGQRPLPLLTPEYLSDVEGFSRHFFRELYSRLPESAVLVLDNCQEVEPAEQFHFLVAQAVEEVALGKTLFAISRRDPPDCYARLIANQNVKLVEWEELKLTLDEARDIVTERALLGDDLLRQLYERSGGWVAGLTLILEQPELMDGPLDEMSRVFDYFAGQIFKQASPATQQFLMATSFLPNVTTSLATSLTGNAAAGDILEDLYRRHLFTHRRPGAEPSYWYHALFRDFLRVQAEQRMTWSDRKVVAQRAASLLSTAGFHDDAFLLFREVRDWGSACQIILERAEFLHASGRTQTLQEWISALPESSLDSVPCLRYWLGLAVMPFSLSDARMHLERVFQQFRSRDDVVGQLRTASSIITSYFLEWSTWQPLDLWIEALERLMSLQPSYPSGPIEFDAYCGMLIATLYRKPGHPLLASCARRVEQMLDSEIDTTRRVTGASMLLTYSAVANKHDLGGRVLARNEHLLHDDNLSPLLRVWWCARITRFLCDIGCYDKVETVARNGLALVDESGLKGVRSAWAMLMGHIAWAMIGMGQFDRARAHVQELEENVTSLRPSDRIIADEWRTVLSLCHREILDGLKSAEDAVDGAAAAGMHYWEVLQRINAVAALADLGRSDEIKVHVSRCRAIVNGTCLDYLEPELCVVEAYALLRRGDDAAAVSLLSQGFGTAKRLNSSWRYTRFYGWMMSTVCAAAIDAGVELDYVRSLVRRLGVHPPSANPVNWPWPIKIFTLGTFNILKEGEPLEFRGKAPRRVLALLKAVIAMGAEDVPARDLIDAIWPDGEGDAGYDTLSVTIGRLRRLLGSNATIVVAGEKVSLNLEQCWIDALAFTDLAKQLGSGNASSDLAERVLALYKGTFLPDEADAPWTIRPRLRLQKLFLRSLETIGRELEEQGSWRMAVECYEQALAVDDLTEIFYQGLMRCHLALESPSDGLSVFRKLRQTLSIVLGISPSPTSHALARQLQERAPLN